MDFFRLDTLNEQTGANETCLYLMTSGDLSDPHTIQGYKTSRNRTYWVPVEKNDWLTIAKRWNGAYFADTPNRLATRPLRFDSIRSAKYSWWFISNVYRGVVRFMEPGKKNINVELTYTLIPLSNDLPPLPNDHKYQYLQVLDFTYPMDPTTGDAEEERVLFERVEDTEPFYNPTAILDSVLHNYCRRKQQQGRYITLADDVTEYHLVELETRLWY